MSDPLLVCRCGEATTPDADDVIAWLASHAGKPHMLATDRHRMPCSPPSGCRRCGEPARGKFRFYCSPECRNWFEDNHWWPAARFTALGYERAGGNYWTPKSTVCAQRDETCGGSFEVNHIVPLNGDRPGWGCCHHQSNLEPLCTSHHVRETRAQRRDGRIGTAESAARLRASDTKRQQLERRQAMREVMNPRMF